MQQPPRLIRISRRRSRTHRRRQRGTRFGGRPSVILPVHSKLRRCNRRRRRMPRWWRREGARRRRVAGAAVRATSRATRGASSFVGGAWVASAVAGFGLIVSRGGAFAWIEGLIFFIYLVDGIIIETNESERLDYLHRGRVAHCLYLHTSSFLVHKRTHAWSWDGHTHRHCCNFVFLRHYPQSTHSLMMDVASGRQRTDLLVMHQMASMQSLPPLQLTPATAGSFPSAQALLVCHAFVPSVLSEHALLFSARTL